MAKVSAKGGFHLLWGLVVSTLISSVGTILIAIFLGEDNMGLYAIAIAAPNLIATFRDWGITTAMVKYSAQYNSENNVEKIRSIFVSGLAFEIIFGSTHNFIYLNFRILGGGLSAPCYSSAYSDNFAIHLGRCSC